MGELDEVGAGKDGEEEGGWVAGEGDEGEDSGRGNRWEAWSGGGEGSGTRGGIGRRDQQRSIEGCMADRGGERGIQHPASRQRGEEEEGHRITPDDEHRGSRDEQSQEEDG